MVTGAQGDVESVPDPVPFSLPEITDEDIAAVVRVMRSGWLTTGEECLALEEELGTYLGMPHVVAMSSCTAAIEVAYASLGLPAGARVGVPTWTFASSATAPHHQGAVPVLLDVDEDTLNVAPASLAAALDAGLDAVVVVHFAGVPVSEEVHDMCDGAGVPVIEDAAHSLGATDHRGLAQGAGTVGACLSFYATKNLTSAEGGALVTDREDVAEFARSFRLHGLSADAWDRYRPGRWKQYDLVGAGLKANLPDVLAALARSQLARFESMQRRRGELVDRYREHLAEMQHLRPVPRVDRPGSAHHLMPIVLDSDVDRDLVMEVLGAAGVGFSVHFQPLHRFGWFGENAEVGPTGVAVAESVADAVLSLPLHSSMSVGQVDRVCDVLGDALAR